MLFSDCAGDRKTPRDRSNWRFRLMTALFGWGCVFECVGLMAQTEQRKNKKRTTTSKNVQKRPRVKHVWVWMEELERSLSCLDEKSFSQRLLGARAAAGAGERRGFENRKGNILKQIFRTPSIQQKTQKLNREDVVCTDTGVPGSRSPTCWHHGSHAEGAKTVLQAEKFDIFGRPSIQGTIFPPCQAATHPDGIGLCFCCFWFFWKHFAIVVWTSFQRRWSEGTEGQMQGLTLLDSPTKHNMNRKRDVCSD